MRLLLVLLALALTLAGPAVATVQRLSPRTTDHESVELLVAFKDAYGRPAPIDASLDEPDAGGPVHLKVSPAGFVQVSPQIVLLISKVEAPFECGRFCTGTLIFHYLRHTSAGFQVLGVWKDIGGMSQFGAAPTWTVRNDLFNHRALQLVMANGGGGCGVAEATLIELAPLGPVVRANRILVSNHSDSAQLTGKIEPVVKGRVFDVVYSGNSSEVVRYELGGEQYYPADGVALKASC